MLITISDLWISSGLFSRAGFEKVEKLFGKGNNLGVVSRLFLHVARFRPRKTGLSSRLFREENLSKVFERACVRLISFQEDLKR